MSKKYIFIKAQEDAKHWLNIYNGINIKWPDGQNGGNAEAFESDIDFYSRREMRPSLHLDEETNNLAFGYKAFGQLADDIVTQIDLPLMMEYLDNGGAAVGYGYYFDSEFTEAVPSDKIIPNSIYFSRDAEGKVINIKKNREIVSNWGDGNYKFACWFILIKATTDIYYLVMNPQMSGLYEKIEYSNDTEVVRVLDAHDGTLQQAILSPSIGRGAVNIADNVILATGKTGFKLDPLGEGVFKLYYKDFDVSSLDVRLKTNLKYTKNDDGSYKFSQPEDGQIGYIYFRIPTTGLLDYSSKDTDALRKSYIVIKG